jgi:hypothetical protein
VFLPCHKHLALVLHISQHASGNKNSKGLPAIKRYRIVVSNNNTSQLYVGNKPTHTFPLFPTNGKYGTIDVAGCSTHLKKSASHCCFILGHIFFSAKTHLNKNFIFLVKLVCFKILENTSCKYEFYN